MSEREKVVCGLHGDTPATFMCRHVATGSACGFHTSENPNDPWPDAWCDACEEAFQAAGGEWNDESEAGLGARVSCTHCYEKARSLNTRVPHLVRGATVRLTDAEQDALVHHAVHELQVVQAASDKNWGFLGMARWDFNPELRALTFTDLACPTVVADVRYVGSFSTKSSTFQWAWKTFDTSAQGRRRRTPSRVR